MRRGYTPEEIADSVRRPLRTVKDDMKRVQELQTGALPAPAGQGAGAHVRNVPTDPSLAVEADRGQCVDSEDRKAVPAAARALLGSIRMGESLRDADEKDVAEGLLTVRDIFEEMGPDYLDDPEPPQLGDGDAPQAKD